MHQMTITTLQKQRNTALDQVALLEGVLAEQAETIQALRFRVEELEEAEDRGDDN